MAGRPNFLQGLLLVQLYSWGERHALRLNRHQLNRINHIVLKVRGQKIRNSRNNIRNRRLCRPKQFLRHSNEASKLHSAGRCSFSVRCPCRDSRCDSLIASRIYCHTSRIIRICGLVHSLQSWLSFRMCRAGMLHHQPLVRKFCYPPVLERPSSCVSLCTVVCVQLYSLSHPDDLTYSFAMQWLCTYNAVWPFGFWPFRRHARKDHQRQCFVASTQSAVSFFFCIQSKDSFWFMELKGQL